MLLNHPLPFQYHLNFNHVLQRSKEVVVMISRTVPVPVMSEMFSNDKNREGSQNVAFFTFQPHDTAGSPGECFCIQSP